MNFLTDLAKRGEAFLEQVDQTAAKTAATGSVGDPAVVEMLRTLVADDGGGDEKDNGGGNAGDDVASSSDNGGGAAVATPAVTAPADSNASSSIETANESAPSTVEKPRGETVSRPPPIVTAMMSSYGTPSLSGTGAGSAAAASAAAQSSSMSLAIERDSNDLLSQEVKTLNDEIKSFKLRNKQLEEQVARSNEVLSETKAALQKVQNQRDQYGLQVTQLQADKDKLLHNVGRLDEIVRRADPSSIPSASGDSSGTSAHVDWQAEHEKERLAMQSDLRKLRVHVSQLESDLERQRQEHTGAVATLQQDLRKAQRLEQQATENFASLQQSSTKTIADKDKLYRDLQSELATANSSKAHAPLMTPIDPGAAPGATAILEAQFLAVKHERDEAQSALADRELSLDRLRRQFAELERLTEANEDSLRRQLRETESMLIHERKLVSHLREDITSSSEDHTNEVRDLQRQLSSMESQVALKGVELSRLQYELHNSPPKSPTRSSSSQQQQQSVNEHDGIWQQLQSLKVALTEKQAVIDKLSTDNGSLRSRLESELNKSLQKRKQQETLLDLVKPMADDDDLGDMITTLPTTQPTTSSQALSSDGPVWLDRLGPPKSSPAQPLSAALSVAAVARPIARGGGRLDNITLRVLNILRRYTFARVLLLVYLGALHLWTFAVLNTCLV